MTEGLKLFTKAKSVLTDDEFQWLLSEDTFFASWGI